MDDFKPLNIWRPTAHLDKIKTEGRKRPPPGLGSPTMIWHLAIWRKRSGGGEAVNATTKEYIDRHQTINDQFFGEVARLIDTLQARGLLDDETPQTLSLEPIFLEGAKNDFSPEDPHRFKIFQRQSLSFVLWWRSDAVDGKPNRRSNRNDPDLSEAFRVLVQFQSFMDHVTFTFYIDAAKPFGRSQLHAPGDPGLGARRTVLSGHLDSIRKSSQEEITSGRIDQPDEHAIHTSAVKQAADYFFAKTWADFQSAFGFELPTSGKQGLEHGVVFLNQRGLMMSMRGLSTEEDQENADKVRRIMALNNIKTELDGEREEKAKDAAWRPHSRSASATLGPVDVFDNSINEPGVILKSVWPFLSAISPGASDKDWVGFGILDFRALYVSPLGSLSQGTRDGNQGATRPTTTAEPEHFLILTKGEPHRRQIGRMIERILALETMRAYAFRNLGSIQNSYIYLRVLTNQLDNVLRVWSRRRQEIERKFPRGARMNFSDNSIGLGGGTSIPSVQSSANEDGYYDALSQLNLENETQLIEIAAVMEQMAPGGSGQLAYSIDRADYFMSEFERLLSTLEIGNIAGWINYEQFVDRGLQPTFNMIRTTGARLRAANDRLESLTDVVQTSALIVQADATRRNTAVLRQIAGNLRNARRTYWTVFSVSVAAAIGAAVSFQKWWPLVERLQKMLGLQ